jgi:hypothetical protein
LPRFRDVFSLHICIDTFPHSLLNVSFSIYFIVHNELSRSSEHVENEEERERRRQLNERCWEKAGGGKSEVNGKVEGRIKGLEKR